MAAASSSAATRRAISGASAPIGRKPRHEAAGPIDEDGPAQDKTVAVIERPCSIAFLRPRPASKDAASMRIGDRRRQAAGAGGGWIAKLAGCIGALGLLATGAHAAPVAPGD